MSRLVAFLMWPFVAVLVWVLIPFSDVLLKKGGQTIELKWPWSKS